MGVLRAVCNGSRHEARIVCELGVERRFDKSKKAHWLQQIGDIMKSFALAVAALLVAGCSSLGHEVAKRDSQVMHERPDMEQLKAELKKRAEEHQAKMQQQRTTQSRAQKLPPSPVCDASLRMGLCYAFTGANHTVEKTSKGNEMACKLFSSKLTPSATCPEQRLLGRCKVAAGTPQEYVLHYYTGGKLNKTKAEQDCANPKSGLHAQGAGQWY